MDILIGRKVSEVINSISSDPVMKYLNNYISTLKNTFVVPRGQLTPFMLLIHGAIAGQSYSFEKEKKKETKKDTERKIEQKYEEEEIEARKGKILGYVEAKSYALILQRISDERENLKLHVEDLIQTLSSRTGLPQLSKVLDTVVQNFISDPLNISRDTITTALDALKLPDKSTVEALINVICVAFNRAFFNARNEFFDTVGVNLLSGSALDRIFYKISDLDLEVQLKESDVPKEFVSYIQDFNDLVKTNEKIDVVLSKFLQRYPNIKTKDEILAILKAISNLSNAWKKKAIATLRINSISQKQPTSNSPANGVVNVFWISHIWEDVFNEFTNNLAPEMQSVVSKLMEEDINDPKVQANINQLFNNQNYKATYNFVLKLGALGHSILLHALGTIPDRLLDSDYGTSKRELITDALAKINNLKIESSVRGAFNNQMLNYVSNYVLAKMIEIDPLYIQNELVKMPDPDKNALDFLKQAEKYLKDELSAIVDTIENVRNNKFNPALNHVNNKFLNMIKQKKRDYIPVFSLLYSRPELVDLANEISDILADKTKSSDQKEKLIADAALDFDKKNPKVIQNILGIPPKEVPKSLVSLELTSHTLEGAKKDIAKKVILDFILTHNSHMRGASLIPFYLAHKTGFASNIFAKYIGNTDVNIGTPTSKYSEGTRANSVTLVRNRYEVTGFPDFFIKNYLLKDSNLKSMFDTLVKDIKTYGRDILSVSSLLTRYWYLISVNVRKIATSANLRKAYDEFLKVLDTYVKDGMFPSTAYNFFSTKNKNRLNKAVSSPTVLDELIDAFSDEIYTEILVNAPKIYESGVVHIKARLNKIKIAALSLENSEASAIDYMSNLLNFSSSCIDLFFPTIKTAANKNIPPTRVEKLISIMKTIQGLVPAMREANSKEDRLFFMLQSSLEKLSDLASYFVLYSQHGGEIQAILYDYVPRVLDALTGISEKYLEYIKPENYLLLDKTQAWLKKLQEQTIEWGRTPAGLESNLRKVLEVIQNLIDNYYREMGDLKKKISVEKDQKVKDKLTEHFSYVAKKVDKIIPIRVKITTILQNPNIPVSEEDLREIETITGIPLNIYIAPTESSSEFFEPIEGDDINLRNLQIIADKLRIDKDVIDAITETINTIIHVRGTIAVETQKITASVPITDQTTAELNGIIPLTPLAKARYYMRTSNEVYLLSHEFIKFLKAKMPSNEYNILIDAIITGLRSGATNPIPSQTRLHSLKEALKVIAPEHRNFNAADICSLYELLDIKIGSAAVMQVWDDIANDIALRAIPPEDLESTQVQKDRDIIKQDIVRALRGYLENCLSNRRIMLEVFSLANDFLIKQLGPKYVQDRKFEDILDDAKKRLTLSLNEPEKYASYVSPYKIKREIVENNLPSNKNGITISDLNLVFKDMETALMTRRASYSKGSPIAGTTGVILSDLLVSGYYSNPLATLVDKITKNLIPDLIAEIDENDAKIHFPVSSFYQTNYGHNIDIYTFNLYLSGFASTLLGILIDLQIDVANGNLSLNPTSSKSVAKHISTFINLNNPAGKVISQLLQKHINIGDLGKIEEVVEVEKSMIPERFYKQHSFYKIIIKHGSSEEIRQHLFLVFRDLKPEFQKLVQLINNIAQLLKKSKEATDKAKNTIESLEVKND